MFTKSYSTELRMCYIMSSKLHENIFKSFLSRRCIIKININILDALYETKA